MVNPKRVNLRGEDLNKTLKIYREEAWPQYEQEEWEDLSRKTREIYEECSEIISKLFYQAYCKEEEPKQEHD